MVWRKKHNKFAASWLHSLDQPVTPGTFLSSLWVHLNGWVLRHMLLRSRCTWNLRGVFLVGFFFLYEEKLSLSLERDKVISIMSSSSHSEKIVTSSTLSSSIADTSGSWRAEGTAGRGSKFITAGPNRERNCADVLLAPSSSRSSFGLRCCMLMVILTGVGA